MHFHQVRNTATGAYSYLLGDPESRLALIIDPSDQSLDVLLALMGDLGLRLHYILMTHAHTNSASAALRLHKQANGQIVASAACRVLEADIHVNDGDYLPFGNEVIRIVGTPGHTKCSVCYRWRDRLFTGDTLHIGSCGDVTSAGADAGRLFDSVTQRLFLLPPETLVFPGYDRTGRTVSTIAEEKACNPLLSERNREAFVTHMHQVTPDRPGHWASIP